MTDEEVNQITDDARRYLSSVCGNRAGFVVIVFGDGPQSLMNINSNIVPDRVVHALRLALEHCDSQPGELITERPN